MGAVKQTLTRDLVALSKREGFKLYTKTAERIAEWIVKVYNQRDVSSQSGGELSDDDRRLLNLNAAMKSAQSGSPSAQLVVARMLGQITDKAEVKHKFEYTAEQYIRDFTPRIIQRLRDIRTEYGGKCPVCGESPLLLDEVREGERQDTWNNTLVSLESPEITF